MAAVLSSFSLSVRKREPLPFSVQALPKLSETHREHFLTVIRGRASKQLYNQLNTLVNSKASTVQANMVVPGVAPFHICIETVICIAWNDEGPFDRRSFRKSNPPKTQCFRGIGVPGAIRTRGVPLRSTA